MTEIRQDVVREFQMKMDYIYEILKTQDVSELKKQEQYFLRYIEIFNDKIENIFQGEFDKELHEIINATINIFKITEENISEGIQIKFDEELNAFEANKIEIIRQCNVIIMKNLVFEEFDE